MAGWYEVATNDKGQFSFVLKAANSQVVLRSQQYESKTSALNGIASVQKNSSEDEQYELSTASDGRFYFNLKAANSQVIALVSSTVPCRVARCPRNCGRNHSAATPFAT